jgi:RNA polymerase sigma-B factor
VTAQGQSEAEIGALFAELQATGSVAVRDTLIERHLQLARNLAARYRYTSQSLEDLEQVASLALVKAVDRFDPDRGVPFAGYAIPTILGELKRHMRDATWALHVPRSLKERVLAVEQAERTLATRLGSAPTVAALAAEAGVSTEEVLEALGARMVHDALPLDPPESFIADTGEPIPADALSEPGDFRDAVDDRLALSDALRRLHHRERTILQLRFADGLTQTEIAERVGLSQMYVSRLLRATLEQLRDEIG